jgi:transposase-like protein
MKKRTFSAKDKAQIIQAVWLGDKELNAIAAEHELSPAQVRKWRSEAYNQLHIIFDTKRDGKLQERIAELEQETEDAYKKIGQLTTQVDWLKKKSEGKHGFGRTSKHPSYAE